MARDEVVELVDDVRADEAAGARRRRAWWRQAQAESAGFVATLVELAERGEPVRIVLASGRWYRGVVASVGRDHCTLLGARAGAVHLALDEIALLRAAGGAPAGAPAGVPAGTERWGSRVGENTLRARLVPLLEAGARVSVGRSGWAELVHGRVLAVGTDVLTLELDGPDRATVFLRLAGVSEVVEVPASGGC